MKPNTIDEKITIAKDLHGRWGEAIRADSGISAQLRELSVRVEASSNFCLLSGVARACRLCDREEGGSCCGAGIEDRYTPELLLINLCLESPCPNRGIRQIVAIFWGERGCVLPAREILCVNYLCLRLQKTIAPEKLFQLQEANGLEMEFLFMLHNRIRNFIRTSRS